MDQNFQFLQTLLQLGWPAIVLVECIVLWRDNVAMRDRLFTLLEELRQKDEVPRAPTIHTGTD